MPSFHRAVFTYDEEDEAWLVRFPAHQGCATYGRTLDEARANALEALQVWLDVKAVLIDEDVHPHTAAAG